MKNVFTVPKEAERCIETVYYDYAVPDYVKIAFIKVQKSGATNMFDANNVAYFMGKNGDTKAMHWLLDKSYHGNYIKVDSSRYSTLLKSISFALERKLPVTQNIFSSNIDMNTISTIINNYNNTISLSQPDAIEALYQLLKNNDINIRKQEIVISEERKFDVDYDGSPFMTQKLRINEKKNILVTGNYQDNEWKFNFEI